MGEASTQATQTAQALPPAAAHHVAVGLLQGHAHPTLPAWGELARLPSSLPAPGKQTQPLLT